MGLSRSITRGLTALFDRPGTRGVLAAALPALGRAMGTGLDSLRFDDGWVHRAGGLAFVEHKPRLRSKATAKRTRHYWGYLYEPKDGDVIVDVGAGYGWEALYYARKVGPSGRVIAIEAHPGLAAMLERSVQLNGFDQVTCLNYAVAEKRGTLFIEDDLAHHLGNAVIGTEEAGLPVEAISLDELAGQLGLGRIDFIKMNIEGAERLAIEGMGEVIKRTAVVAISCHDFKFERTGNPFFRTRAAVERWVADHGLIHVPRPSEHGPVRDQVNAYNPALVDPAQLNNAR